MLHAPGPGFTKEESCSSFSRGFKVIYGVNLSVGVWYVPGPGVVEL